MTDRPQGTSRVTGDRADWFLDEVVIPTVAEFMSDGTDVRRGMLASLTVSHLAEYIYDARPELRGDARRTPNFLNCLAKRCASYGFVRDVADATKHSRLGRPSAVLRDVSDVREGEDLLLTEDGRILAAEDGQSLASWIGVEASLPDGGRMRLDELLTEALSFLKTLMGRAD